VSLSLTSAAGTVTFSDPSDGFWVTAGKYWARKPVGARNWAIELSSAPSNDGYLVSRHGFRGMPIGPLELWFIGVSQSACITAFTTARDALENTKLSVSIPDWSTFDNCSIHKWDPSNPKQSGTSLYRMRTLMTLSQDRNS